MVKSTPYTDDEVQDIQDKAVTASQDRRARVRAEDLYRELLTVDDPDNAQQFTTGFTTRTTGDPLQSTDLEGHPVDVTVAYLKAHRSKRTITRAFESYLQRQAETARRHYTQEQINELHKKRITPTSPQARVYFAERVLQKQDPYEYEVYRRCCKNGETERDVAASMSKDQRTINRAKVRALRRLIQLARASTVVWDERDPKVKGVNGDDN